MGATREICPLVWEPTICNQGLVGSVMVVEEMGVSDSLQPNKAATLSKQTLSIRRKDTQALLSIKKLCSTLPRLGH